MKTIDQLMLQVFAPRSLSYMIDTTRSAARKWQHTTERFRRRLGVKKQLPAGANETNDLLRKNDGNLAIDLRAIACNFDLTINL